MQKKHPKVLNKDRIKEYRMMISSNYNKFKKKSRKKEKKIK